MTANAYSSTWFDVFSETRPSTDREIDFLVRHLPNPPCRVLDVCCGRGRLSVPLARMGYDVVGVDENTDALDVARVSDTGAQFVELDVRDLTGLAGSFDAVICTWQSFGFLSRGENEQWFADMADKLVPGGRMILDVYNGDHWARQDGGTVTTTRAGVVVETTTAMRGDRLSVELTYDGDAADSFNWQLFTADELVGKARQHGLEWLLRCTDFDERRPIGERNASMQLVFGRGEARQSVQARRPESCVIDERRAR